MKYKALIFDLDGTAIHSSLDALPSEKIIEAVNLAKQKVIVSIATGRPIADCRDIIYSLKIDKPCIVAGGTQIIDPITEKVIWTKRIDEVDIKKILDIAEKYHYKVLFGGGIKGIKRNIVPEEDKNVMYILNTDANDAEKIMSEVNLIENVIAHEAGSWTKGKVDIHITHKEATKKNSLQEWLRILKLKPKDVIAVGDRSNDLPLFSIAGYKIAVANAVDELKAKADFIAPSVYDDGLAFVIEKFIL